MNMIHHQVDETKNTKIKLKPPTLGRSINALEGNYGPW